MLVFGYLGWDQPLWDARQQALLHLVGLAAIAGMVLVARRGELPRTPLDLPIALLVVAFAAATAFAENVGLAARALAGVVATAALLPVALVALRRRPEWVALVVAIPVIGLAAAGLVVMLARRIGWYAAGGGGLAPVRLPAEGTPFGSVAVPPFIILAALPLTLLIEEPRLRRWTQAGLVTVGVPATLISGSRSAWLTIAAVVVVLVAVGAMRGGIPRPTNPRSWSLRAWLVAVAALPVAALALAFVAPRLTAVTSLVYRGFLWRDTLAAWGADPMLGVGPAGMPVARQAAAPPLSFPELQPHSHNIGLGILGEAGIVGLATALLLVGAFLWIAGPWRMRSPAGTVASATLVGLLVGSLFEDLTFLPNFNLIVVLLLATALADAGVARWVRPRPARPMVALAGLGVMALVVVAALGDAGAITYRQGVDAMRIDRPATAVAWLRASRALDPFHPSTAKALSLAADAAGDAPAALAAARDAVELSPGDGQAWANLAQLCLAAGDDACAADAARHAVDRAALFSRELANAAVVHDRLGDPDAADDAYARSLLTNRNTALALRWPRPVITDGLEIVEMDEAARQLHEVLIAAARGEDPGTAAYRVAATEALAHAIGGRRAAAATALERAETNEPASPLTWEIGALLHAAWGDEAGLARAVRMAAVVRGSPLPARDATPRAPPFTFDSALFRIIPGDGLVRDAVRLLPDTPWPWVLERYLPAG